MTGTDLRAEREGLGLSRAALARLVLCSETDLYRWETGRVRILAWREPQIRAELSKARRAAGKREPS